VQTITLGETDKISTTFMVDDWIAHTPLSVVAKNFGVNQSVFSTIPAADPYIFNGTVSNTNVTKGNTPGPLTGDASFVYRTFQKSPENVPGGAGEFRRIDSTNFPASKTIAATYVRVEPGGLRELHWHPNVRLRNSRF
jgi:oxalate decarboxylase